MLWKHRVCKRCGTCSGFGDSDGRSLKAANAVAAGIGEKVEIEIAPTQVVLVSFLILIVPTLLAFIAGLLGYGLARDQGLPPAAGAAVLAGGSLALTLLVLRRLRKALSRRMNPVVVKTLLAGPPGVSACQGHTVERGC